MIAAANASVARGILPTHSHSRHPSLAGSPTHSSDHVFGGMSPGIGQRGVQHGLPKLETRTLDGPEFSNVLRTAPPMAAFNAELDFEGLLFGPGSTIKSNALHYNDPPQSMTLEQAVLFAPSWNVMPLGQTHDGFEWLTGFDHQMPFHKNENVADGSSPSAFSTTSQSGICDFLLDGSSHPSPVGTSTMWQPSVMGPPQMPFPFAMDLNAPCLQREIRHHSRLPHAPTDADFAYGSDLVSPSSVHSSRGHYDSGFPGHWDDTVSHGASTPKVSMPAGHVTNNPWAELDQAPEDNSPTAASRPKRTPRSRRQKKEARKTSEASQGGSSSAGDDAPSASDVASPSSASQNSRASIRSKSTFMTSTVSTTWNRQSKLRSASRASKNSRDKLNDAPEERRARASHNRVEEQYSNRLNAQFESHLNALPAQTRHGGNGNGDDNESDGANDLGSRVSKGEVLEMARKHLQALERERHQLERENLELEDRLRRLKGSASDGKVSSSGQETPFDFNINTDQEKADDDRDKD
ncbi:hypothetical protein HZ326_25561 [Fusarium oxysporum f. sp. albedinis]|nr:hypothetical protein HZ326_25561 [Fusarium oxysporum f. sp. albedinis]